MSFIGAATAIIVSTLTAVPVVISVINAVKASSDKDKSEVIAYYEEDKAYYKWLKQQDSQIELDKQRIRAQLAEREKQRIEFEQKALADVRENQLAQALLADRENRNIEPLSVENEEDFESQQVKTTNTTSSNVTVNGGTNITISGGTNTIVINNITKQK